MLLPKLHPHLHKSSGSGDNSGGSSGSGNDEPCPNVDAGAELWEIFVRDSDSCVTQACELLDSATIVRGTLAQSTRKRKRRAQNTEEDFESPWGTFDTGVFTTNITLYLTSTTLNLEY